MQSKTYTPTLAAVWGSAAGLAVSFLGRESRLNLDRVAEIIQAVLQPPDRDQRR